MTTSLIPSGGRSALLGLGLLLVGALSAPLQSCSDEAEPWVSARRVQTRGDLIGGPSALGEVGDFLLENDKVRFIVQDKGYSRGFGVYATLPHEYLVVAIQGPFTIRVSLPVIIDLTINYA